MKHIAKFAPIIGISGQVNELEKKLTGPRKFSGVSRNGPPDARYGSLGNLHTNTTVFLLGLCLCGKKELLARAVRIQKENWGKPRIFQRSLNLNLMRKCFFRIMVA